jgi:hypothetical protein
MVKVRHGADKALLVLFPFVFIAVLVVFSALVWAFQSFVMPVFK